MNNSSKTSVTVLLLLFIIIISHSCKKDNKTLPALTTANITGITQTSAVSGGNVTENGGASIVSRGVCWNTSNGPTTNNNRTIEGGETGSFISNLTSLTPGTLYYVRAYATNKVGTAYGNQITFTTSSITTASLTTTAVASITRTSAVSGGNITSDGGGLITSRGVCWAVAANPTTTNNKTIDGIGTGSFTSNLSGLEPGTTYYIRSYATNSAGTSYGNELTFTTTVSLATVTTAPITEISYRGAKSGGNITSDGGFTVTARGVVWSVSIDPTINDSKTIDGAGGGAYTSSIIGLIPSTTYYVRAYATNIDGTAYGMTLSFKTLDLTDVEGNVYKVIKIGNQTWMAENLKVTKYNDETLIPQIINNNPWRMLATPGYCWYNNDEASCKDTYGALYNWYTVNTGKLCPAGWHVPTDAEFKTLERYLGMSQTEADAQGWRGTDQGTQIKSTSGWDSNGNGTNTSGFTAIPGGYREIADGKFYYMGKNANFWSATENNAANSTAWSRYLYYNETKIGRGDPVYKGCGFSVRCVKD